SGRRATRAARGHSTRSESTSDSLEHERSRAGNRRHRPNVVFVAVAVVVVIVVVAKVSNGRCPMLAAAIVVCTACAFDGVGPTRNAIAVASVSSWELINWRFHYS
ncbi:unnamed protein product, partial [Polarella glacialis]